MRNHPAAAVKKQKIRFLLVTGVAAGILVAAAFAYYPLPWRTMQDGAGSAFTGVTEIDLNTADLELLCLLPGVGPQKAAAILSYREIYGAFDSLEEVLEVQGIGEATVASWNGMAVVR